MTRGISFKTTVPISFALVVALALATGGCGDSGTSASDVSVVELVQSFGFCPPTQYCVTRLRVLGRQAIVTLESRANGTLETSRYLRADEADAIARSAARTRFESVGPVIGCPDCADGGAESLSVTAEGQTGTVTFEYNARISVLEPLLGQMRSVLATTRPVP
jgi:hypothetical protein